MLSWNHHTSSESIVGATIVDFKQTPNIGSIKTRKRNVLIFKQAMSVKACGPSEFVVLAAGPFHQAKVIGKPEKRTRREQPAIPAPRKRI